MVQVSLDAIAANNTGALIAIACLVVLAVLGWRRDEYRDGCPTCRSDRARKRLDERAKQHENWHRAWGKRHCPWCKEDDE